MQLTRFSDYALRLLLYLQQHPDENVALEAVCAFHAIPRNHLSKVSSRLSALGHVQGIRGKNGGLRLNPAVLEVRLGDLLQQLESMDLLECFEAQSNQCCLIGRCRLQGLLYEARAAFLDSLNRYRFADLSAAAVRPEGESGLHQVLDGGAS